MTFETEKSGDILNTELMTPHSLGRRQPYTQFHGK